MLNHDRHASIGPLLVCCLFAFGPTEAFAACDYISEYTDLFSWQISELDGTARIDASGTAEGHGDDCGTLYIEVELSDPSGDVRHMRSASGGGYASTTAYQELDGSSENEEQGDWHAGLMTWENGTYIGCGDDWELVSIAVSYLKDPTPVAGGCWYANTNCTSGVATCGGGWAVRWGGTCPAYIRVAFLKIGARCMKVGIGSTVTGGGPCS